MTCLRTTIRTGSPEIWSYYALNKCARFLLKKVAQTGQVRERLVEAQPPARCARTRRALGRESSIAVQLPQAGRNPQHPLHALQLIEPVLRHRLQKLRIAAEAGGTRGADVGPDLLGGQ